MVAETDQMRRLFRLMTHTLDLVADGKRNAEEVARTLQTIKDDPNFSEKFFPREPKIEVAFPRALGLGTAEGQMAGIVPVYRELFGFEFDTESLCIPEAPEGFNRLIVSSDELTPSRIVMGLRKRMKVWTYTDDLDAVTERASYIKRPKDTYAVWVRENAEADEDMKSKSALDLEEMGVNCLTLEERLLYETLYFSETGRHLDYKNWTICAGSRNRNGGVPCVRWRVGHGEVCVGWAHLDSRLDFLRARLAVS